MKDSTIVPPIPQGPQVPIRVSRPAWKLWKYLESLYRIGGWVSPKLRFLAKHFGRSVSTIKRWMGELFAAGVLATQRRGPRPPLYTVLVPTTSTCNRDPFIITEHLTEPTDNPPTPLVAPSTSPEPSPAGSSYHEFSKMVEAAQLPQSSTDRNRARQLFFQLSMTERIACIAGLKARIVSGEFENPVFRPRPDNFLRNRVWERPVREKHKTWKQIRLEAKAATQERLMAWARSLDAFFAGKGPRPV